MAPEFQQLVKAAPLMSSEGELQIHVALRIIGLKFGLSMYVYSLYMYMYIACSNLKHKHSILMYICT